VSYTLSRTQAVIVQYDPDTETDMFQIGRSSEGPIDFVVMDTVPGDQRGDNSVAQQSTISRFACRIIVERSPPYVARIYAAGFDVGKNIFLGVRTLLMLLFCRLFKATCCFCLLCSFFLQIDDDEIIMVALCNRADHYIFAL